MNLGQLLGQQYLRIAELEEQVAATMHPKKVYPNQGVLPAVRALLAETGPLTGPEIADRLPQFKRRELKANLRVARSGGYLVRAGDGKRVEYALP